MLRKNDAPPIHVPDLAQSKGAQVQADGTVRCVSCKESVAAKDADIVGLGYRCATCSRAAELQALQTRRVDTSANLSARDRQMLRASARRPILIGIGLLVVGAPLAYVFPIGTTICAVAGTVSIIRGLLGLRGPS